ncbi:hypothetical protein LTR70_001176 [Exophiala xenobiotica]|uniref:Uncharacterized protein n=1 Tax=Lithohypha guttulata TaxID=1690604 RepID=A0ABR0K7Y1_9EURO|nr:hypothetical protein LTR24_005761 [Lithohypha guttulata]KAK5328151.1 hypothetical protein LTR70_001176 [Exophiala xenobiotica]
MADAKFAELGELFNRLAIGGGFQQEYIRERALDAIICYLRNVNDGVQGAATVQALNKHCDEAAKSLGAESLLIPCGSCHGKGEVEIGFNLLEFLRSRDKPRFFKKTKPSQAPAGYHWICTLCLGTSPIRKKASDLQKHLRDAHRFSDVQVRDVFNPRSDEALYEHFGPCTHSDAKKNGWDISPVPAPRTSSKPKPIEPALPKGYEPMRKQTRSVGATIKPRVKFPEPGIKGSATFSLGGSTLQERLTSSKTTDADLAHSEAVTSLENGTGFEHSAPLLPLEEPLAMSIELGAQHPNVDPSQYSRRISEFNDTGNNYADTHTTEQADRIVYLLRKPEQSEDVLDPALFQPQATYVSDGTVDPRVLDRRAQGGPDGASRCGTQ